MKNRTGTIVIAMLVTSLVGCSDARRATVAQSPAFDLPAMERAQAVSEPVPPARKPSAKRAVRHVPAALVSYGSCGRLVRAMHREGLKEVTAYGLGGNFFHAFDAPMMGGVAAAAPASGATGSAGSAMSPAAPSAFSGTNNQEVGVDEPDLVKTDGQVMVLTTASPPILRVIDVSGSEPARLGAMTLRVDSEAKLLLMGETVVAIGSQYTPKGVLTVAHVVSIKDPRQPRLVRTFQLDGDLLDARLLNGRVLLVTRSSPQLPFAYPTDSTPAASAKALHTNRELIRTSTRAELLPKVTVLPSKRTYRTGCANTLHPGVDSGLESTSVVTIDPAAAAPTQNLTVVGTGSVVYASTSALYLATSSWESQTSVDAGRLGGVETDLHGFDVTTPDRVSYLGTGTVQGNLLNQYALSEHKGYLRVATTVGEALRPFDRGKRPKLLSDSRVTILQPKDGALVQVGQVRGLGRGERIYGVRFIDDMGYVVTFREVDPLYVLDLSDPRTPRLKGELKVTGYSSTLFPLGDGQLLGIGQDVDAQQRQLGTQVSVFDVQQVSKPTLLSKVVIKNAWSSAQHDHHSLLWWGPKRLVVLPVTSHSEGEFFQGAMIYRVSPEGALTKVGKVSPPTLGSQECCAPPISRDVVVGNVLYSVTDHGLMTTSLDKLDEQGWFEFG